MSDSPTDKPRLRVLLADRDPVHRDAVARMLAAATHRRYALDWVTTAEAVLDAIAADAHDVCLLGTHLEQGDAAAVLTETVGTGWRSPVILLVDTDYPEYEREIADLGGADYLVWTDLTAALLDRSIRNALQRKTDKEKLRATKEDLIRRLLDLQDVMERVEKQGAEHAGMAEQLELLNQEKTKLFSIISHDLRSPFTSLLGLTEFMAKAGDKLKPEQFIDYAGKINESGKRIFRLLENLLEWAQLQMGSIAPEPGPQDLRGLAQEAVDLLTPVGAEKQVSIVNDTPALRAFADRPTLNTVIRNLVNNAVKFTPSGGTVRIEAREDGGYLQITVRDTGVGIPPERIAGLFRIGANVTTPGTKGERGTGLGLALCRQLIELNGGRIWAESTPGKGSAFHVTVRRAGAGARTGGGAAAA